MSPWLEVPWVTPSSEVTGQRPHTPYWRVRAEETGPSEALVIIVVIWQGGNFKCLLLASVPACSAVQSCPALCDPMDCSSPGSSVHGILQIRKREFSQPKDWTCISCIGRQVDSLPLSHLQSPLGARPYPKQFPHIISFRLLNNQLLSHLIIPMRFLMRKTNSVIRVRSFSDFSGGKKPPIKEHFGKPLDDFRNDHRCRTESIAIKARSCGKYWQDYIKHFYRVLFQIWKGGATSVRSLDDDDSCFIQTFSSNWDWLMPSIFHWIVKEPFQ